MKGKRPFTWKLYSYRLILYPQGALAGLIFSTVVMFWIVIGSFVYDVPMPVLPFSTEGCAIAESTFSYVYNAFTTHISDLNHVDPIKITSTLTPWVEW